MQDVPRVRVHTGAGATLSGCPSFDAAFTPAALTVLFEEERNNSLRKLDDGGDPPCRAHLCASMEQCAMGV